MTKTYIDKDLMPFMAFKCILKYGKLFIDKVYLHKYASFYTPKKYPDPINDVKV